MDSNSKRFKFLCRKIRNLFYKAHQPALLVIDPLVAAIRGDEDNAVYMRSVFNKLKSIADTFDMAVLVVHHPRKRGMNNDPGQMIRGSSDIRNAVSSHISLCVKDSKLILKHDKCRFAPMQEDLDLMLENDETSMRFAMAEKTPVKQKQSKIEFNTNQILSMLHKCGEVSTGELREHLSLEKSSANVALKALEADRRIESVRHGHWQLVAK